MSYFRTTREGARSSFVSTEESGNRRPISSLLGGLIEWWEMQETSAGSSPVTRVGSFAGLNLTDNNNIASDTGPSSTTAAKLVRASSQYFSRANSAALHNNGATGFEFCGWFRADSLAANSFLFSKDAVTDLANRQFNFVILTTTGQLYLEIHNTGGGAGLISDSLSLSVSVSTWYMLNFWFDTSNSKGYASINAGTPEAGASTLSGTLNATGTSPLEIGARSWGGGPQYSAVTMNRVGFWNRLLTSGERTALYNAGAGKSYPF